MATSRYFIELKYGYYIEIDRLGYTLKHKRKGKIKDTKEEVDTTRICGYYASIWDAIDGFLKENHIDKLDDKAIPYTEVAKTIEEVDRKALLGLQNVLKAYPWLPEYGKNRKFEFDGKEE